MVDKGQVAVGCPPPRDSIAQTNLIPQSAPGLRVRKRRREIDAAISRVLESGSFILGREIEAFECEFASYLGLPHAIGVNSGTDAIIFALQALGVGPGDSVLVPALSAPATAVAVQRTGAIPCFVDIEPYSRGMDPELIKRSVGRDTKAVIAVHLHGIPARIEELVASAHSLGLPLVEDCAQAHGVRIDGRHVGTFGDVATYSFYPTKNLGALGDGGCVVMQSGAVAAQVRSRRFYGFNQERICVSDGTNSRLDEIQAAVLRVLLPHLDEDNEVRAQFAGLYDSQLAEYAARLHGLVLPPKLAGNVYHQYALEMGARDRLRQLLSDQGVATLIHYAVPLHRHPIFGRAANGGSATFPVAERLASRLLSLPIQAELREFAGEICIALRHALDTLES